ncbi:MAG TPA: hypothetical protein PKM17_03945 [Syntrophorhabdus sp.]|jgi:hypothetical protein|nr:hypothetical protein [Syntrophorhabdus sp.]OPX97290.1 MAG: hypothetical protein A4E59_00758 [Syntrophorhabdus sp. PtaB.Bin027]HNS77778.1 hypothetical protein [Syntrophorhabdus sp.]HOD79581.1 hypothetical protein [Syntrophorhabdus sp.]HQG26347.1 hypothetical protein [Syntrophorhabdus sp.]
MKNFSARKKKGDTLPVRGKDRMDLCTFCFAAPYCVLVNSSAAWALECEEFRAYDPTQESGMCEKNSLEAKSDKGSQYMPVRPEYLKNRGLCSDCAIYDSCPFPKNRGEVWCCEEYR